MPFSWAPSSPRCPRGARSSNPSPTRQQAGAIAVEALQHTGVLLATCQLGITICSVLLGAISEAALHHALHPVMERIGVPDAFTDATSLVLAILVVVYLHVVVGEMVPKNLAIAGPEKSATILVPPLMQVMKVAKPIILAMDWVSKAFVRAMGIDPKDEVGAAFTAEEVQHIVTESHREGLVETEKYGLVGAALEFSDKDAADVGVPVADLVTVPRDATPDDIERLVAKHGFSRYPTVDEGGELTGYLHLKDVLYADETERSDRCPASACAAWPRSARATRSRTCSRPCSARAPTWPGSATRRVSSSASSSSRTSSRSSWER